MIAVLTYCHASLPLTPSSCREIPSAMASSRDARDILGLPSHDGATPQLAKPKRPKTAAPRTKGLTTLQREVASLHGERTPPIYAQEVQKAYKPKRLRDHKRAYKWY